MPWTMLQQMLLSRGYWQEADGGEGGSGGGAAGGAGDVDPGSDDGEGGSGGDSSDSGKPSEAEAKLLKEVMNKKSRIKALEEELGGMKKSMERFSGIDPDEVAKLMKERADAEKAQLESKQDWEKLKERMAAEHTKEKTTLAEQVKAANEELKKASGTIERLTVGHNFDNSKFLSNETVLTPRKARKIYGDHFDVNSDGSVIGFDAPRGESDRSQLIDGQGAPLPFEAALKRLIDDDPDRDEILRSKRKPGASSGTGDGKPAEGSKKTLTARDKIALGLAQRKKK